MNRFFWPAFVVAALLCGTATQFASWRAIGTPSTKPPIPIPGREYVSATRDGQTDQSLFYFNLFGFGDRIKNADALVIGSSHAEFGIEAAMLSRDHPFNMALGGGEGLSFAALLLEKYRPHPSIIALDPFSPDGKVLSSEASRVVTSTRAESYRGVFQIWSGFLRDWILQGLLPRVTIAVDKLTLENPIGPVIVRNWATGDVTAVYSGDGLYSSPGEVFSDPARGHVMSTGPEWPGLDPGPGLAAIKAPTILVTTVPYPGGSESIAREAAARLGALFVHTDAAGIRWFDYHHVNKASRTIVTEHLLQAISGRK